MTLVLRVTYINNVANVLFLITGDKDWRRERKIYDKRIAILEPFIESIPSVMVQLAIWFTETWIRKDLTFQG